ncbi:MAG: hypothetical protein AB1445_11055 [Bacillota bacterium]
MCPFHPFPAAERRLVVVLTPAESKRLIAKAVVQLPPVQRARQDGRIIVATGTTNAYVAEELLGPVFPRNQFISGHIIDGGFGAGGGPRLTPFVIDKGQLVDTPWQEALAGLGPKDALIKGANAVDPQGNAGVLLLSATAGTIGAALGIASARGVPLIMPVGLEKLVPSVVDAAIEAGLGRITDSLDGRTVGMMPVVNAEVVTEIQAMRLLYGVEAVQLAGGGIGGSEGSVVLLARGTAAAVEKARAGLSQIKGEPAYGRPATS